MITHMALDSTLFRRAVSMKMAVKDSKRSNTMADFTKWKTVSYSRGINESVSITNIFQEPSSHTFHIEGPKGL